ncbi:MAG: elongation factor 4 [Chloroflexi bacterium]|nr:MAG: elongation factor 4 [Chloroflexota bacterium]
MRDDIRAFAILAHIDHGKTTLSDRLLDLTGTIPSRQMREQFLDAMELEREKGITIKAHPIRMRYQARDGKTYTLYLIDTPGHVDFSYEVSRSIAACEGAVLLVDATQGIEAQTLANAYLALEHGLEIIPVVNKIDLPNAQVEQTREDLKSAFGFTDAEILTVSAKEGTGVPELLEAVVARVPPPKGSADAVLRGLIFDSKYDSYKGVLAYVRIVEGVVRVGERVLLMQTEKLADALEVGFFSPDLRPVDALEAGEVGYVATGLKTVADCRVGDTLTSGVTPANEPLPGYRPAKPMVFAGFYPSNSDEYPELREALEKLRLNDAAFTYEPESSGALGHGFRCGFLGVLHMEIVQERLEREYDVDLIATAPSVEYRAILMGGEEIAIDNPAALPDPGSILEIREPWVKVTVITPGTFVGNVMELVQNRRGTYIDMSYLDPQRAMLRYEMPLGEVIVDLHDQLKSRSQGYASMDYELSEYRAADLVRLDILVGGQRVDALSMIVHRDKSYKTGLGLVTKLKELIPRQLFEVAIQAAIGGKVISRATVQPLRKNVLAKCYGGDVTRKRKLLEKQKEGKKRLKLVGNVEIPQEAFLAVLRIKDEAASR